MRESTHGLAFLADGKTLLAGGGCFLGPGDLTTFDCGTGKVGTTEKKHRLAIWGISASPDGKWIATGGGFGQVILWDAASIKPVAVLNGGCEYSDTTCFSPDSRLMASCGDKTVKVWNTETRNEVVSLPDLESNGIHALAFSGDGKILAVGDLSNLRLYGTDGYKEVKNIPCPLGVRYLAFSPDGKILAVSLVKFDVEQMKSISRLQFLDTTTWKEIGTWNGHDDTICRCSFTPDGRYLATASLDETSCIVEVKTGKTIARLTGLTESIRGMAISPNGKYLALAGYKTVQLYDLASLLPPEPKKQP